MKHSLKKLLSSTFCFLFTLAIFAQEKTVTGVVTDRNGVPVPGVNIIIKGTTTGTQTNFDGEYNLEASPGDVLVFSFLGLQSIEQTVGQSNTYNVVMEEDSASLDEVVVIGYGTQRRSDITGAISSISAESIPDAAPLAPEQILQGRVTGVNIVQNSGQPGAASTVRIRGISSISAGNDPLYVVDGVPLQFDSANNTVNLGPQGGTTAFSNQVANPLNIINPADIQSIDVLKDASATAIYGSRGANGVIIITTKDKSGLGETLSYDSYVGVANVRETLPFLSAEEYRNYAESIDVEYPDLGANTNWQEQIFRTALTQNHNLAFAGGSNTTKFRASFGYTSQEGVILSNVFEKYTGRFNGSHRALDDRLRIGVNMTYASLIDDKVAISSSIGNEGGNILKDALRWAPTLPVYNEDGSYYQLGELRINPLSWVEVEDLNNTDYFLGNTDLKFDLLESLALGLNLGYSSERVDRFTLAPETHPSAETEGGRASISKFKNTTALVETTLTFDKQLDRDNYLNVLGGYSFQRFQNENTFTQANQFVSTATRWNLIQSGFTLANTSFKEANRLSSYYGRVNYRLMDKYLFTVTIRRDGSSRFGENNRWGTFPSGAFAYNISNEEFLQNTKVSNLKFRLGYGITGNQEIPNNLYREQLSISGSSIYVFGGQAVPSVLPTNYANPDLQWEETSQLNVGLDFGFFNQRITGTVDYYIKKTDNLLLNFSTAAPSVVNTQWANVGEVENRGFEFGLTGDIIATNDFTWTSNINFSTNRNEVISLSNENFQRDEILTGSGSGLVGFQNDIQIIRPGLPINSFYGRKFTGLDDDGMETFLDEDGDGDADLLVIGNPHPDLTYGFNNTFRYKRFDASINVRGVVGNDIYNNTAAEFSYPATFPGVNILESALTNGNSREQQAEFSSRWLEDGSYLRLDNLSVGYNFNTENLSLIKNARIYVTGKNLLLITDYSGFDPEFNIRGVGIDYLAYPRPTTYLLGGSITF